MAGDLPVEGKCTGYAECPIKKLILTLNTILLSSDARVTSTDHSAIAKDAPRRSKVRRSRVASSTNSTSSCCSSTDVIEPSQISGIPKFVKTVKFKTVLDFFHIANLRNASSDEAMFSRILYSYSADLLPPTEMLEARTAPSPPLGKLPLA